MPPASSYEARNPAHPEMRVGSVALRSHSDIESAIEAAHGQQPRWAADAHTRADALEDWATQLDGARLELADLVVREVGKPILEAEAEVARAIRIIRYYAQATMGAVGEVLPSPAGTQLLTERIPLGVVLLVTPWNFPVAIPTWKMAPALAFGNAVLFRPSRTGALVADRLVELASAIPPGLIGFIPSDAKTVDGLIRDDRIAGVSFTGSTEVGRSVVVKASQSGRAVQAEMGGLNAAVVLDDADPDLAAATIADAAMRFAGQKCTATRRVIVAREAWGRFVPTLVDHVRSIPMGDPADRSTLTGPMISDNARRLVRDRVNAARDRGGAILTGGSTSGDEGWYFEPTVVHISDHADPLAAEELFGPVLTVQRADSADQAIALANRSRFGLSGAVYGADVDRARRLASRLEVGMVRVNAPTVGIDFHAPFGGLKSSSYGPREQGTAARDFYTVTRTVFVQH